MEYSLLPLPPSHQNSARPCGELAAQSAYPRFESEPQCLKLKCLFQTPQTLSTAAQDFPHLLTWTGSTLSAPPEHMQEALRRAHRPPVDLIDEMRRQGGKLADRAARIALPLQHPMSNAHVLITVVCMVS